MTATLLTRALRKRLASEPITWQEIVEAVAAKYELGTAGNEPGIRAGLAAAALLSPNSGIRDVQASSGIDQFRPQDVEPLLDQAVAILDRASADRWLIQQLGEKLANLMVELTLALNLDAITLDEEAAGRFSVAVSTSRAQEQINAHDRDAAQRVSDLNQTLYDFVVDTSQEGMCNINRAAMLAYTRSMYSDQTCGLPVKWPVPVCGTTYTNARIDVDTEITRQLQLHEQHAQALALQAQIETKKGQIASADCATLGLQAQRQWDEKNVAFLHRRADAVRQANRMRVALESVADALDFDSQIAAVRARYQQQVIGAYTRLEAVATGLELIYAYSVNGKPDPLPLVDPDTATSIDAILAWTRRVAAWLAALTRKCHNYVLPISMRQLAGTGWADGKAKGEWSFVIGTEMFDESERLVRIRGACGWCVGKDGPYTLDVWLPGQTHVRYPDGTVSRDFDQKVPRFRLGRVLTRGGEAAEVSGLTALFNASPFGNWRVRATSPALGKYEAPDDFQIDLYLSVLPVESKPHRS